MAVRFDDTTESLSRTTNMPSSSLFTMMGWFYRSVDTGGNEAIMAFELTAETPSIYVNAGTDLITLWTGGGSISTGITFTVDSWVHLAIVCSGTGANELFAYVDGVQQAVGTIINSAAVKLWIANDNFTEDFNGRAAAVKIYSDALGVNEIVQEMRQYLPVRTANLNGFYPLLSTNDDEIDFSGNGNNWTVGGTLATEDGPPIAWKQSRMRLFMPISGDYITSGSNPSNDTCEVKLAAITDPSSSVGHVVHYRYRKNATTRAVQLTVKLIQGTTEIASWTETLTTEWEEQQRTLSAAEANSITDYSDLRLRFIANQI